MDLHFTSIFMTYSVEGSRLSIPDESREFHCYGKRRCKCVSARGYDGISHLVGEAAVGLATLWSQFIENVSGGFDSKTSRIKGGTQNNLL
jgi:hypothetical protein